MNREKRMRAAGVPDDVARLAMGLSPGDFEAFIREVQAPCRPQRARTPADLPAYRPRAYGAPTTSPARAQLPSDGSPTPPRLGSGPMARLMARAQCSPDQRAAMDRIFGPIGERGPTVGRTAIGELVMSHIGQLPAGATVLSRGGTQRNRTWAA